MLFCLPFGWIQAKRISSKDYIALCINTAMHWGVCCCCFFFFFMWYKISFQNRFQSTFDPKNEQIRVECRDQVSGENDDIITTITSTHILNSSNNEKTRKIIYKSLYCEFVFYFIRVHCRIDVLPSSLCVALRYRWCCGCYCCRLLEVYFYLRCAWFTYQDWKSIHRYYIMCPVNVCVCVCASNKSKWRMEIRMKTQPNESNKKP